LLSGPRNDPYWADVEERVLALVRSVETRLTSEQSALLVELVANREPRVALEILIGILAEDERPVGRDALAALHAFAEAMPLEPDIVDVLTLLEAR
jgi:hypothetical protein